MSWNTSSMKYIDEVCDDGITISAIAIYSNSNSCSCDCSCQLNIYVLQEYRHHAVDRTFMYIYVEVETL